MFADHFNLIVLSIIIFVFVATWFISRCRMEKLSQSHFKLVCNVLWLKSDKKNPQIINSEKKKIQNGKKERTRKGEIHIDRETDCVQVVIPNTENTHTDTGDHCTYQKRNINSRDFQTKVSYCFRFKQITQWLMMMLFLCQMKLISNRFLRNAFKFLLLLIAMNNLRIFYGRAIFWITIGHEQSII